MLRPALGGTGTFLRSLINGISETIRLNAIKLSVRQTNRLVSFRPPKRQPFANFRSYYTNYHGKQSNTRGRFTLEHRPERFVPLLSAGLRRPNLGALPSPLKKHRNFTSAAITPGQVFADVAANIAISARCALIGGSKEFNRCNASVRVPVSLHVMSNHNDSEKACLTTVNFNLNPHLYISGTCILDGSFLEQMEESRGITRKEYKKIRRNLSRLALVGSLPLDIVNYGGMYIHILDGSNKLLHSFGLSPNPFRGELFALDTEFIEQLDKFNLARDRNFQYVSDQLSILSSQSTSLQVLVIEKPMELRIKIRGRTAEDIELLLRGLGVDGGHIFGQDILPKYSSYGGMDEVDWDSLLKEFKEISSFLHEIDQKIVVNRMSD